MEYSLRTTSHVFRVRSQQKLKNKKCKQAKLHEGDQTSEEGAGGEEGERASAEVPGSPKQSAEKDSSTSSSLRISKLRSKLG